METVKKVSWKVLIFCVVIICTMSLTMVIGCEKEIEPRKVVLELVNPITSEAIQRADVIDLPEEGTPIEVRIKDKETGRYLTDDDLPENTIEGSYHINFNIIDLEGNIYRHEYMECWPTKDYLDQAMPYTYYEIAIFFDCRPDNPKEPMKFQRRYEMKNSYIRFYINKPWRENPN